MYDWKNELNEEQLEAANILDGPLLILAGAGSGKTKTMTSRICHLIESGVKPSNILAITFTNKAAKEMRSRLINILGIKDDDSQAMPLMCTFHSFGYRIIRKFGDKLGYGKKIDICDEDDSMKILKKLVEEMFFKEKLEKANNELKKCIKQNIKDDAEEYAGCISKCKDNLLTEKDMNIIRKEFFQDRTEDWFERFELIYTKYEAYLKADDLVDFDDLIEKTVFLLRIPGVKKSVNNTYKYINVDEYQDTSVSQLEMVKLLAGEDNNICVVGDDYQSIYAFRGAVIENILNFPKHFEGCRMVILKANYRSIDNIVDGSAAVIKHNRNQFDKDLYAARGAGDPICLVHLDNNLEEGHFVASKIKEGVSKGAKYSEFAVLYRKNINSRSIEDALLREKIPYIIYGGVSFYQRKEIKDITGYLRLAAGYKDIISLERIANFPARGIGKKTLDELIKEIEKNKAGNNLIQLIGQSKISPNKVGILYSILRDIREKARDISTRSLDEQRECLPGYIKHVMRNTGMIDYYREELLKAKKGGDPEKIEGIESRIQSLEEYVSKAADFANSYIPDPENPDISLLEAYLEEVTLFADSDISKKADSVSLMTMHKSKGLEFKTVFMVAQDVYLRFEDVFGNLVGEDYEPCSEEIPDIQGSKDIFSKYEYFSKCTNLDDLVHTYKKNARLLHPDCGGDPAEFVKMNAEYQECMEALKNFQSENTAETINEKPAGPTIMIDTADFELEEERRLFYVGMTRAMDNLYISYVDERMIYGDVKSVVPVRFISEIPAKNVSHIIV